MDHAAFAETPNVRSDQNSGEPADPPGSDLPGSFSSFFRGCGKPVLLLFYFPHYHSGHPFTPSRDFYPGDLCGRHFSWDRFGGTTDYARAWNLANRDKHFKKKAYAVFLEHLKTGKSIYVDNTNLTIKRRKPMLEDGKKHGYITHGITFDVDLKTAIARQATRGDKYVPEGSVIQQFNSLQPPAWKEFDKTYESTRII